MWPKNGRKKRGKSWVWNHIKERVKDKSGCNILSYVYQGQYQDI